jgi:chemotaxis signal transduction protein
MKEAGDSQRMEAVWRKRASRLSQRPVPAGAGGSSSPVIVLGIAREHYGIDLPDVTEVLPLVRVTPVPGAPAVFAGVINVHGVIQPVIDLGRLLRIETVRESGPARVILLRRKGQEVGLQIDSVEKIRWIGSGELQAGSDDDTGSFWRTNSQFIRGSTKDRLMLLSTEALFAELKTGVTA